MRGYSLIKNSSLNRMESFHYINEYPFVVVSVRWESLDSVLSELRGELRISP